MVWVVIIFFGAFGIMIFNAVVNHAVKKGEQETVELRKQQVKEWEADRGTQGYTWIELTVPGAELQKIGKLQNETEMMDMYFVVDAEDGLVHFSQPKRVNTWEFRLLDIQYQGRFVHETISQTSGKGGSALGAD